MTRGNFLTALLVFIAFSASACASPQAVAQQAETVRARDLGVPFDGVPGPLNAITDVAGVEVGMVTLIEGAGKLEVGKGPVRTGVTAILPRGRKYDPVYAGWFSLNGNGEMTGTTWVEESGWLEGPVMITNTHSVGTVRDAVIDWSYRNKFYAALPDEPGVFWALPVVAETYDGDLNDYRTLVLSSDRDKTSPAKAAAAADTGDKADQRRKAAEAREAAAPLKKKAQEAEKTMERLTAKIASLDADLARPDIAPHETRQRLKDRARFVAEKETAEATWLEASEAYDAAVR